MKVLMNSGGIAMTNAFLVVDEPSRLAVLFDAPNDTTALLLDEAQSNHWDIIGLWLTHGHFDHMADHALVRERFPAAKILIHRLEVPKLADPNALFPLPFHIPPCTPDILLEDNQTLTLGALTLQVLHTPGHAAGHVVYHCPDGKFLVGGDLIIQGAVGRTDLPDSDEDQLFDSLRRVMTLPPDTRLLPGHGQPTTLDHERRTNPYIRQALQGA